MPNQPKTPNRTIRISDETWERARLCAAYNEEALTEVIVKALDNYSDETMARMSARTRVETRAVLEETLARLKAEDRLGAKNARRRQARLERAGVKQ